MGMKNADAAKHDIELLQEWQFEKNPTFNPEGSKRKNHTFGWISTRIPTPIFALNVILGYDEAALAHVANTCGYADEMLALLKQFRKYCITNQGTEENYDSAVQDLIDKTNTLIAAMEG
jgi:hypothetical protein